jgi:EAL domain-containing protein (putative c-di-GMP-specific phosphodiesterase class I)
MVLILTKFSALAEELKKRLLAVGITAEVVSPKSKDLIKIIYKDDVDTLISDPELGGLPDGLSIDILNSLGHRIPCIILSDVENHSSIATHHISDQLTVLSTDRVDAIVDSTCMYLKFRKTKLRNICQSIPYYNIRVPVSMLQEHGGLGVITIDASSFSKIGLEYGVDVYNKIKAVFQSLLFHMWGKPGCFRLTDILCRKSMNSNIYYVFLNKSRETGALPLPGSLERIADRLGNIIQNALWEELFAGNGQRVIPPYVKSIPLVGVGFVGVLQNPCIDAHETIENGLEFSRNVATFQVSRVKERQRELMQTLIQSEEMLLPNYQAVFELPGMTEDEVKEIGETGSIANVREKIFGFESLIRVQSRIVESRFKRFGSGSINPKFLNPDVLFSMAKSSKVALELDQACLKHAAEKSEDLPGVLMVNILPRNLYYIEKLKGLFEGRKKIIFEVSESESISNFELMIKSCDYLEKNYMGIAADDFGRGYSSLERIIKIKPNIIKFDRSMIQNIHNDPVKQAYVKGMVEAAKILKTKILAEGVELWEEAKILQAMGIDLVQGFLFHRPQRAEDILADLGVAELETVA